MKNQIVPSNLFLLSLITVSIFFIFVAILYLNILSVFHADMAFIKCIHRFQSLIAGLLALVGAIIAAIITALYIKRQVEQNDDLENEQRRRKSFASRSVLSPVLSKICSHAKKIAHFANEAYENRLEQLDQDAISNFEYSYTSDEINIIKECVEHADDNSMYILTALVRRIQYTQSRINGILEELDDQASRPIGNWQDIAKNRMCDALKLYAEASNIFGYADGKKDAIHQNIDSEQLISGLNALSRSPSGHVNDSLRNMVESENFFSHGYDILKEHFR